MKTKNNEETYWSVVADCLVEFHGFTPTTAAAEVRCYHQCLARKVTRSEFSLIFHEEPFQVACEIAGKKKSIAKHRLEYENILSKRKW